MKKMYFLHSIILVPFFLYPQQPLMAQTINITRQPDSWRIQGVMHEVTFNEEDFSMSVLDGSVNWTFIPSDTNDIVINTGEQDLHCRFADAKLKEIEPYQTGYKKGLKITLSRFRHGRANIDLVLQLFLCLEGADEDLVCSIVPIEKNSVIRRCEWPKGLRPEMSDFTIVPAMQGMLLPRTWQFRVQLPSSGLSQSRGLYMPWWGHLQGKSALLVLMETPDDGGCEFSHPAGGPTAIGVKWLHSLGKMSYPRRLRFCFIKEGNIVTLAKRYRRYVIEKGHFVSLTEKIARNKLLEKLIGSPVVHTGIYSHIEPTSRSYNTKDTARNNRLVTFAERAQQLKALSQKGVPHAYVHLDGWGYRGYDNLHPDVLPPCPKAGGWEGMKQFAEVCDNLDYVFAVHDQYRDYYLDAASYDPRHTILNEKGERPAGNTWAGGNQSILCSQLAPGYVVRNYRELLAHNIKIRGAYLDVFSVVPPDECYNPEHPVTRSECLRNRAECFNFIRSFGGIVSSEESEDWSIPYLDLVHWGPFALDPGQSKGRSLGIPIPLFSLVYHDALLMPWTCTEGKGGWGIPENDCAFLYALLNGGMPYLSISPNDSELERIRKVCALHKRVGLLEMINHEFIDNDYRKQRTTFSDGTVVTIDLDKCIFDIYPRTEK